MSNLGMAGRELFVGVHCGCVVVAVWLCGRVVGDVVV